MSRAPRLAVPAGACDCHMHIFGPAARFPYGGERDYTPPDATLEDYVTLRHRLGLTRTVVVQPSIYGSDHACALDAMARLDGRGVAVVGPDVEDAELERLTAAGMRAVRFHSMVEGCLSLDVLEEMAGRVGPFGWHLQVQFDGADMADLAERLAALPVDIVIDHMGRIPMADGVDGPCFKALLRLVDGGRCWVKLSAPYHVSREGPPAFGDCAARARALVRAAPERMLWGSNWPHPTAREKPNDADLLDVLGDWAGDEGALRQILVENPLALFQFDRHTPTFASAQGRSANEKKPERKA